MQQHLQYLAMMPQVPSHIFCADSSTSLESMVTLQTLDADETNRNKKDRGISRGLLPMTRGDPVTTSQPPCLPKRKPSEDLGFRESPYSIAMIRQDCNMLNATFERSREHTSSSEDNGGIRNTRPSLVDRLGCLAPIVSPAQTVSSRKTHASSNSDSPLTMPRRKPSQQQMSMQRAKCHSNKESTMMSSDFRNADFDDLMSIGEGAV